MVVFSVEALREKLGRVSVGFCCTCDGGVEAASLGDCCGCASLFCAFFEVEELLVRGIGCGLAVFSTCSTAN